LGHLHSAGLLLAKYDPHDAALRQMNMLTCPHCHQSTKYSFADEFDRDAGRFICGNCKKEFFALNNNEVMAKKEFQANLKSLRGDRAYAS
jgi:transposase-like protein